MESKPLDTKQLVSTLLKGLDVHSRDDGSVHTIKAKDGSTVAEVCAGKRAVRVNFRAAPGKVRGVTLGGKSKSWAAGAVATDENAAALHAALTAAAGKAAKAAKAPSASDAAAESDKAATERTTAAARVKRSGVKVTA